MSTASKCLLALVVLLSIVTLSCKKNVTAPGQATININNELPQKVHVLLDSDTEHLSIYVSAHSTADRELPKDTYSWEVYRLKGGETPISIDGGRTGISFERTIRVYYDGSYHCAWSGF